MQGLDFVRPVLADERREYGTAAQFFAQYPTVRRRGCSDVCVKATEALHTNRFLAA
jgi:hypothetical protein